ncbi:hypothetical protein EIJ81_00560 (plasmid) [Aliivibrio salmonicida]|uniref:hypothetical protein n=1 Tax=Aliivibrio salmonicida TaxID=40269 RepID=UPI000F6DC54A|nr:hypothetical protein [Aliivibrio salmonicida]AZL83391.1 hypothetical protein EIJ81_00560 [Aliivibrio salmonicida]
MLDHNKNSSKSQSDSVRLTEPNSCIESNVVSDTDVKEAALDKTEMETKECIVNRNKDNRTKLMVLLSCGVMFLLLIYQQFQISNLTTAVSMNIVELNSLNAFNKKNENKIAVLPLRATIEAWSKTDPSGITAMKAIDKTINVYKDAGYLILDGDSLVGGPAWAELISITPQDLESEQ